MSPLRVETLRLPGPSACLHHTHRPDGDVRRKFIVTHNRNVRQESFRQLFHANPYTGAAEHNWSQTGGDEATDLFGELGLKTRDRPVIFRNDVLRVPLAAARAGFQWWNLNF